MAEDDVRKGYLEDVASELRPRLTKGMKRRGKAAGSVLSTRNSTSKSLKLEKTECWRGSTCFSAARTERLAWDGEGRRGGSKADASKPAWGSPFSMKNEANGCFLARSQTYVPKR